MKLEQLRAALLRCRLENGHLEAEITSITSDSRKVTQGSLFIALRGYTMDGHEFVRESVEKGAAAVVVEEPFANLPVPQLVVPDTYLASGILADVFYNHPSSKLRMIGVTGTNGKSTVTHLIEKVLQDASFKVGLSGTLGVRIGNQTLESSNTTPFAVDLQEILHHMVEAKCTHGVMEVSSHALDRRQTAGTNYKIAVFTNLTQDHLDYHGTMEKYLAAKAKLFSRLGNGYGDDTATMAYGVLNRDDEASEFLAKETVAECLFYGIEKEADVRAEDVLVRADGVSFKVTTWTGETALVQMQLTGRFNVYNALAAISVGLIEGVPLRAIVKSLSEIPGVPGRLERVPVETSFTVLVDYSHTPDSLKNALETIREFAKAKVITVVGCGGDRDKGKRPLMAQISDQLSDVTILTSDNPRTENPETILDDMEAGLKEPIHLYRRILDRGEAIREAVRIAEENDVILIAGKGHENYQIIGRVKHHFDDREAAADVMRERSAKSN